MGFQKGHSAYNLKEKSNITNLCSSKEILKRYKKSHNPEELEGSIKICSHCGVKQYRCGRFFTPCVCKDISKYPKKIRNLPKA